MLHEETSKRKNVFRNGKTKPTAEQFTKVWIALINQLEKSKGALAGVP